MGMFRAVVVRPRLNKVVLFRVCLGETTDWQPCTSIQCNGPSLCNRSDAWQCPAPSESLEELCC